MYQFVFERDGACAGGTTAQSEKFMQNEINLFLMMVLQARIGVLAFDGEKLKLKFFVTRIAKTYTII